ncbi:MAG: PepSY domain-containing protein [Proteobacteria bacterium]|nr:PepSY domain-containing protein [Pseudomonadota bacterium]
MTSRWYNAVWRWHFYAGLFCVPFVIWLSCTGALYLWRPQIEAWLDRPYDSLSGNGAPASPEAQVSAALKAVPGSQLQKYYLPQSPTEARRIIVGKNGEMSRVYVDPYELRVLNVANEESRPFRLIFHLHGELLAGALGSYLVEIAACWTIVMLITGMYLWWPRGRGLAGVVYPRLSRGGRGFWRDIHATAGFWVSIFALFLIATGLPWAKGWGTYLGEIRELTGTARGPVDWTIGGKQPGAGAMTAEHHAHMSTANIATGIRLDELERVSAAVSPLHLAPPVSIKPPATAGAPWIIASEAANRPLRSNLTVDGHTGRIIQRTDFSERHWIDKTIGYGVAAHEGQLFGIANQILGTLTALFLILLSVSGVVMWWKRRPAGTLGAPMALARPKIGAALVVSVLLLAVYMPMFGLTLIFVLLVEALALRHIQSVRRWLGLRSTEGAQEAV